MKTISSKTLIYIPFHTNYNYRCRLLINKDFFHAVPSTNLCYDFKRLLPQCMFFKLTHNQLHMHDFSNTVNLSSVQWNTSHVERAECFIKACVTVFWSQFCILMSPIICGKINAMHCHSSFIYFMFFCFIIEEIIFTFYCQYLFCLLLPNLTCLFWTTIKNDKLININKQ